MWTYIRHPPRAAALGGDGFEKNPQKPRIEGCNVAENG